MKSLGERLRAGDPARAARPLDPEEILAMRRAMAAARPAPRRTWALAGAAALTAGVLMAILLWPAAPPTRPLVQTLTPPPAPVVQAPPAPEPAVAEVRPPRPRPRPPAPPAAPAQVREIRFVTASGTQILWTIRSSEEGA